MQVKASVSLEPALNGRVFMCRVVIDNEVQIKFPRGFPVDLLQQPQPFDVGMGLFSSRDNFTFQIAQSRKERDRAVPDIVMGLGTWVTFLQRKGALCALQGLALTQGQLFKFAPEPKTEWCTRSVLASSSMPKPSMPESAQKAKSYF
jgi:hypothetical protein